MSASAGKVDWDRTEITGQGAAFRRLGDVRILAVVVPNPVGVIMDRAGGIVRGNYDAQTGVRRHPVFDYQEAFAEQVPPVTEAGNTTISAIVTNVRMSPVELNQFAKQWCTVRCTAASSRSTPTWTATRSSPSPPTRSICRRPRGRRAGGCRW